MIIQTALLVLLAQLPNTEQTAALDAIRQYARTYTRSLPNYTCTQITRENTISTLPFGGIRPGSTLIEEQLTFVNNREARKVVRVDGRSVPRGGAVAGTSSHGEFGNLLDIIFKPESGTSFQWQRTGTLNRRRVYVFAFRVPQASGYGLVEEKRRLRVPFSGLVYADAETKAVVRIEMKCTDIPPESTYVTAVLTLDYKPAQVAGQKYILPAHFLLSYQMKNGVVKDEAEYSDYKRFSADVNVTFEDEVPQT